MIFDALGALLLIPGCALALIAALGLLRFPDVFTRMHAATKPATLGMILVMAGTALRLDAVSSRTKLLLVIVLQLLTTPVGAHMIGRAAHRAGELSDSTIKDDLARAERQGY